MRILVCGGRSFANQWKLECALNELASGASVIIHGGAGRRIGDGRYVGADLMAGAWARGVGIKEDVFPAQWARYGKNAAGPMRNREMADQGKPDFVIAFSGGSGTNDMKNVARSRGIIVVEIY